LIRPRLTSFFGCIKNLTVSLLFGFLCALASAEYVTIANKDGQEIEVELLSYENGRVEFALRNEDGSIGHASASVNQWTRSPELIDGLKVDQIIDRDLR
jgi:hypothetical protein